MGAWLERGRREGRRGLCMLSAIIEVRTLWDTLMVQNTIEGRVGIDYSE